MRNFFKFQINLNESEEEAATAILQTFVYVVFAIVTTIIALSTPSSHIFFFRQSLDAVFINREVAEIKILYEYSVTMDKWLQLVNRYMLDKVSMYFHAYQNKKFGIKNYDKSMQIDENYAYGPPKILQIRVKDQECIYRPILKTNFTHCYPMYSFKNEDTSPTFKGTPYYHVKAFSFPGNVEKYKGPGYIQQLKFLLEDNEDIFANLSQKNWFDYGTRFVSIELIIYNIDTVLLGTAKLCAEYLPTGTIIPHWEVEMVPMQTIWSVRSPEVFLAGVTFFVLVTYYASVELQEFLESGPKAYFSSLKNYIDLVIATSAFVYLSLSIKNAFNIEVFIEKISTGVDDISLDTLYFAYCAQVGSMAICVFLVWAKILRFIGFNKTMIQFQTTLVRCTRDILGFALMFTVVFMAFSLCGLMIFGDTKKDFSTFQDAFFSMIRMVLGDFQYRDIQYANRVLSPIFYLLYVLSISLILLNMFLAIINNTYIEVKLEKLEERHALKSLLRELFYKLKNKIVRKAKTESKKIANQEDDMRSLDEFDDQKFSTRKPEFFRKRKDSLLSALRRPFHKSHAVLRTIPLEDEINDQLIRLSERIDLLEDVLTQTKADIDRILGRVEN